MRDITLTTASTVKLLCAVTIAVSVAVLVGWCRNIPALTSLQPGSVSMQASTALGFILAGMSLALLTGVSPSAPHRWLARGCAASVALLGFLTFCRYYFGLHFDIDQFLFHEPAGPFGAVSPGRMALTTALNFLLFGCALLLAGFRRGLAIAQRLALFTGFMGLLPLLGHLYGATRLLGIGQYTQMAAHTAMLFIVLSVGVLLLRPAEGVLRLVTGDTRGGWLFRRLGPFIIGLPILLGWLRIAGEHGGYFESALGTALMMLLLTILFTALIGWTTQILTKDEIQAAHADVERKRTVLQLIDSERRYRRLFEAARDGILILNAETGMVVEVNPYLVELLGVTREVFLGKKVWELGFFKDLVSNEANFLELQTKQYIRYEDMALEGYDGKRHEVEFVSNVYLENERKVIQCNIRDISERKRAEEVLWKSSEELARINSELARFLYTASHDLKSPLVTIRTFLGFLEQDLATGDAGQIAKDMHFMRGATEKMVPLLDDLLEMARVGRVIGLLEHVTFRAVVDDAVAVVAGRIAERGITIHVDACELTFYADRVRLVEIFQNLLDNACKFMADQPAPRIEIGVETRDAETVFFVRDNGGGIDPRHQAKVFGLFEKLDPLAEGTGMGLTLVKQIVELHGGRIWVASDGLGQGAAFYFTLPGAMPPDDAAKPTI